MAFKYITCDRNQPLLLPPDIREWLPADHLVWFVLDAIDQVDTQVLHARHPNNGPGRPAYDPVMLLALLIYSYCLGVLSSRQIERACHTDVAYRVICANLTPDHSTISRFRADHEAAVAGLFTDVLVLCAQAGLLQVGTVAIDGTKMAGAASRRANRTLAQLRKDIAAEVDKILGQAANLDAAEDRLFGPRRGDELPAVLADRSDRLARLTAAARLLDARAAEAAAQAEAAAAERAAKAAQAAEQGHKMTGRRPKGQPGVDAAEADLAVERAKAAQRKADRAAQQATAAASGRKLKGRVPDYDREVRAAEKRLAAAKAAAQAEAEAAEKAKPDRANTTDPDSRLMKRSVVEGWLQAYNAQAATNTAQIVLTAYLTQDPFDVAQLQRVVTATQQQLDAVGIDEPIGVGLADAGYWSQDNATAEGMPDLLIATQKDWKQRKAARELGETQGPPPADATPEEAMEHRLRTAEGHAQYKLRGTTIEPVFGQTKHNRGIRAFSRRGLAAADSEWKFINLCHNLLKLYQHRQRQQAVSPATPVRIVPA